MTSDQNRPDFKVADLSLAEFGRKEIVLAEHEMPGLMAMRAEFGAEKPLQRGPDHRFAAHDRADRRPHRDADRARRRGALGQLQHLLDPGPRRRRRGRRAATAPPMTPRASRSSPGRASSLEEYWWCTEQALLWPGRGPEHDPRRRRRRHPARPQGRRVREGRRRARPVHRRLRGVRRGARRAAAEPGRGRPPVDRHRQRHQGRLRGDHDRRAPPLRDGAQRRAPLPGHQRQRRGDEVEVRQQVRLPPLAHRRDQPGHRRADRRQGGGGLRLRRRGQGLCRVAAGPGRPGGRHRDRPDLRAAGSHGGLPGGHPGRRRRHRRHLRDRHRQQGRHHGRPHGPDEAPGHRGQHRSLRQRDRHGRPRQPSTASSGSTSSPRSTSGSSPTATP